MKTVSMNLYKFSELERKSQEIAIDNFLPIIEENDIIFKKVEEYFKDKLEKSGFSNVYFIYNRYEVHDKYEYSGLEFVNVNAKFSISENDNFLKNEKNAVKKWFSHVVKYRLKTNKIEMEIRRFDQWQKNHKRLYKKIESLANEYLSEIVKKIPGEMKNTQAIFKRFDKLAQDVEITKNFLFDCDVECFLGSGKIVEESEILEKYLTWIHEHN